MSFKDDLDKIKKELDESINFNYDAEIESIFKKLFIRGSEFPDSPMLIYSNQIEGINKQVSIINSIFESSVNVNKTLSQEIRNIFAALTCACIRMSHVEKFLIRIKLEEIDCEKYEDKIKEANKIRDKFKLNSLTLINIVILFTQLEFISNGLDKMDAEITKQQATELSKVDMCVKQIKELAEKISKDWNESKEK